LASKDDNALSIVMNTLASSRLYRLEHRSIISVAGTDARSFLQRLVTAEAEDLADGVCRPAALLTAQGKLLVDFMMFADGDGVALDVATHGVDALLKRLKMYKLRADISLELCQDRIAVWSPAAFDGSIPDPRLPAHAHRGICATSSDINDGQTALEALEIAHGVPLFGRDYAEGEVFPTDVNLDVYGGIGWTKGCFIGQEVVSRMKRRGTIRKRSVAVSFDDDAPKPGTRLTAGGATLGEITSANGTRAIARLRLDRLDAASEPATAADQPAKITLTETLRPEAAAGQV
jgi:folate-binding protein YgfZ